MLLGCHLSIKDGYLKMAEDAVSIHANTFQFFTRNPRGSHEKELSQDDLIAFKAYCDEHRIKRFVGYAPYTINPATDKTSERDFSQMLLSEDLARMEETPHQLYALHPGHAGDQAQEAANAKAAAMFNEVLEPSQTTTVLLVNNAGEGTALCSTFEQMADLLGQVRLSDHMGMCFDTSAAWASGYDVVDGLDEVLDEIDRTVGLDKVRAVHLTDSKEGKGSHVDRHVKVGTGSIGFEALVRVLKHPKLAGRPFILEVPRCGLPEYEEQLEALKMACTKDQLPKATA